MLTVHKNNIVFPASCCYSYYIRGNQSSVHSCFDIYRYISFPVPSFRLVLLLHTWGLKEQTNQVHTEMRTAKSIYVRWTTIHTSSSGKLHPQSIILLQGLLPARLVIVHSGGYLLIKGKAGAYRDTHHKDYLHPVDDDTNVQFRRSTPIA